MGFKEEEKDKVTKTKEEKERRGCCRLLMSFECIFWVQFFVLRFDLNKAAITLSRWIAEEKVVEKSSIKNYPIVIFAPFMELGET